MAQLVEVAMEDRTLMAHVWLTHDYAHDRDHESAHNMSALVSHLGIPILRSFYTNWANCFCLFTSGNRETNSPKNDFPSSPNKCPKEA